MSNYRNETHIEPDHYSLTGNTYTAIQNHILRDEKLGAAEIGILSRLLSYGSDFIIHKGVEQKKANLSRYTFDKAWKVLTTEGYIKKEKLHRGYKWIIIANPKSHTNWGQAEEPPGEYNLTLS